MSVREDLIIQADDITIIQGEKPKDYNVKVISSETGNPLLNIYLNITFYNDNQSIVRTAKTNIYGVATVPIMLSSGAWFVDVHFKGNDEYKPCVVTKEINIEKFTRLDSEITSENLVINIDNDSMDGIYYTIHLKDSNGNDIIKEPVNIVVKQTGDNPQTYMDMILKTDDNGIIKIPFLSYDENVIIISQYMGCARYKSCIHSDIVTFEEVNPRSVLELRFEKVGDYNYLQYKIDNGVWEEFPVNLRHILDEPIINLEDDNRTVRQGWYYLESMNIGIYKVTLCFDGGTYDDLGSFYPFCRTFIYESYIDTRKDLTGWISLQEDASKVIFPKILGSFKGCLYSESLHYMWRSIADVMEIIVTPYDASFIGNDCYDELKEAEVYSFHTIPYFKKVLPNESNVVGTFLNFDYVSLDEKYEIHIVGKDENFCSEYEIVHLPSGSMLGGSNISTITQDGFGYQGQTYQNIDITVSSDYASMHERVNDYYMMKILNIDTLEEFYFYSYLVDNITPSHNEFELSLGNWEMAILGKETQNYQGAYYTTTASITDDTIIIPPQDNIITSAENYINLGTDTPTFVDDTITTSTTDDDIHSIMALEFTNSNYYRLSFNAEVTGDTAIIYGADPTLETMDGLFINNDSITLYNDDIEMDKLIFDTPIFNQTTNNILFQRYGNQFTIFVNDEQVYKTELLSWNTFGVYQNATGSEIELSYFALEPYITTEITPSVADYDGTIFGSNIHLEIDDNTINLIDYGMLPSGAIGGGKIILNDVPLESANKYAIQLEMKYNNTRFERLNNLTGQMQMRVYEDIMSSDTVKDYEKTLCSPMPVPNSRTVFTRHSNEGTLYFVQDPLNANSSFLTNAYNQYKGGCSITSETGIYLSNLDNAISPVFVGNELVRAEFHRRSGFIRISRYDESTGDWATVNTFKLRNYPQLSLNHYNDDYAEIQFGNTTWKFYRGRPFIVLNHSQDDLRIMNLVDRVYCETVENQRGMGFIIDQNPNEQTTVTDENGKILGNYSTFNPQLSIQQFKQELHIGENIRLDNFELYEAIDGSDNIDLFVDNGTTASNNEHWYINSYGTATVQSDGTKLLNTMGTTNFVMRSIIPSNKTITEPNTYSYNSPYIVEFDIVETNGTSNSDAQVQIYSLQTNSNFTQGVTTGHYKIEVTSEEQKIWVDDTLIKTTNLSLPNARITLRVRNSKYLIYKNFKVYQAELDVGEVATNSQLGILNIDNDNALQIYKDDSKLALNFPSYSSYVERVNDTFTLSIDYLDCPFENIKIKARGFNEKGAVPVKDGIQYGIWEQTVDVEVDTTATDSVRATFTNCPSEVKYIDFVIFFTGANSTDIIMKDLMYYDGDAIINHDVDTSRLYAEQVEVQFADTYFANIYNEKSDCGLCIARPNQEPFTLTTLNASSETVLIPYMKKSTEWDKPQQVFLEYLNAKQQVIDIDWEN